MLGTAFAAKPAAQRQSAAVRVTRGKMKKQYTVYVLTGSTPRPTLPLPLLLRTTAGGYVKQQAICGDGYLHLWMVLYPFVSWSRPALFRLAPFLFPLGFWGRPPPDCCVTYTRKLRVPATQQYNQAVRVLLLYIISYPYLQQQETRHLLRQQFYHLSPLLFSGACV